LREGRKASHERPNVACLYFYEMSRTSKSIESGSRLKTAGLGKWGKELLLIGVEFLFEVMKMFWNSGSSFTH
jgi:hypothetical protein